MTAELAFGATLRRLTSARASGDGNSFFPSPDTRRPSSSRRAQRIERPCAGAMGKQHEEPAGDRQILLEMQELIAIAELGVKKDGGEEAKSGEEERGGAGVVAAEDQSSAPQFDRDSKRQQLPGDAESLHIGERRRIGRELAPGLVQEYRREQEAGRQARPPPSKVTPIGEPQLTLAEAPAIACSRSASSSQPPGHSFFRSATFSRALSTCPVST